MNHNKPYNMFDEILFQKNYSELTSPEKGLFENQQEFEEMKQFVSNAAHCLEKDSAPLADPAIETRLLNTLNAQGRSRNEDVKKHSFADLLMLIFSPQFLGAKLSIASVLVVCSMWFSNPQVNTPHNITADTTYHYTDTSAHIHDDSITAPVVLFIH